MPVHTYLSTSKANKIEPYLQFMHYFSENRLSEDCLKDVINALEIVTPSEIIVFMPMLSKQLCFHLACMHLNNYSILSMQSRLIQRIRCCNAEKVLKDLHK